MEFNIGDTVKRKVEYRNDSDEGYSWSDYHGTGEYEISVVHNDGYHMRVENDNYHWWVGNKFENVESANSILTKTMDKKVFKVLIVDKKTGKTTKDEAVIAETEQQAILKAFGVDSENAYIKVDEVGNFKEEKPITAIIVKNEQSKKDKE